MKISWKGTRLGAVAVALAVAVLAGCTGSPGGGTTSTPGVPSGSAASKAVGAIEQEQIFKLPEFVKAKEELDKLAKEKEKELEKKIPKDKAPTPDQQRLIRDAQLEIQKETSKRLNPLKARAEAAVAQVAREKKMLVVLDKRIVVYGVTDITEDVKKLFQGSGEIKLPDELDTTKAPIGYFDQEVVRSLKLFQEADMAIYKKRMELLKQYEEKAKKIPASERELLERELRLKMEAYQEQVMSPLIQQVNDSVKDVAQAQSLSLVLDKQHVMQGGRNMTNEVVEAFLKRAGVPTGKPKPSGTPGAATATPSAAASATPGAR